MRTIEHSLAGAGAAGNAEHHMQGPEGVAFSTRAKVVTARWPHVDLAEHQQANFSFPTAR